MIIKKLDFSGKLKFRIDYEFAAREEDAEKRKDVEFCGGNLISDDPFYREYINGEEVVTVDTDKIVREFEDHARNYKGNHNRICAHYMVSLQPGETLNQAQWLKVVRRTMESLGYDRTTKYVAVIHRDTDVEHVHIVACRARFVSRNSPGMGYALGSHWQLVKDSNDYDAGMTAMRELEAQFGLRPVVSDPLVKEVDRMAPNPEDHAQALRAKIKVVLRRAPKVKTMSEFALALKRIGVEIKAHSDDTKIYGLSYRLAQSDGRWITGSKLSGTQLTWNALQSQHQISYVSSRDDAVLLKPTLSAKPDLNQLSMDSDKTLIRAYLKIHNVKSPNLRLFLSDKSDRFGKYRHGDSLFIGFNLRPRLQIMNKNKQEVKKELEIKFILDLMESLQRSIKASLDLLFSLHNAEVEIEGDFDNIAIPAVKILLPAIVVAGEIEPPEDWEHNLHDQMLHQLGPLAQAMHDFQESRAPSL